MIFGKFRWGEEKKQISEPYKSTDITVWLKTCNTVLIPGMSGVNMYHVIIPLLHVVDGRHFWNTHHFPRYLPKTCSFSAAVLWICQVMLVGAGTCMRNTDKRCLAINGRTWKLNRDYLKSHLTVVRTGPWLLIKGQFHFKWL